MRTTTPHVDKPKRQTKKSAGYDFYMPYDLQMAPGVWYTIDTEVIFDGEERPYFDASIEDVKGELKDIRIYPKQWVMNLAPRSSLGNEYGFKLANTIGVIDQDFIGHHITAKVSVDKPLFLKKGRGFMQGEILTNCYLEDEDIPDADRVGGHGSTDSKVEDVPAEEKKTETAKAESDASPTQFDPTCILPLVMVAGKIADDFMQSMKTDGSQPDLNALLKAFIDTKP